jgi:hypothetical protein
MRHAHVAWDGENATEADFRFFLQKVPFPFLECRNRVFCEAATEKRNQKVGTTPHINSRAPGMRISALVSLRKPLGVYFGFCASSGRFC